MQMAMICGAIGNGGQSVTPTYIKGGSGDLLELIGMKKSGSRDMFLPSTATKLTEVLPDYTYDDFGGLTVKAKTGTAEVGEDKKPNAWMVGFSTDADCPLAFACVVENAGFGSQYAKPVAQTAMKYASQALKAH